MAVHIYTQTIQQFWKSAGRAPSWLVVLLTIILTENKLVMFLTYLHCTVCYTHNGMTQLKILLLEVELSYSNGRTDGHTYTTKLTVDFRNFSTAPKNCHTVNQCMCSDTRETFAIDVCCNFSKCLLQCNIQNRGSGCLSCFPFLN